MLNLFKVPASSFSKSNDGVECLVYFKNSKTLNRRSCSLLVATRIRLFCFFHFLGSFSEISTPSSANVKSFTVPRE